MVQEYPFTMRELLNGGLVVKSLPATAGDMGSIPGSGRFLEKEMVTHSSILAWKFHGQRSLAIYSPWHHKRVRHDVVIKQQ